MNENRNLVREWDRKMIRELNREDNRRRREELEGFGDYCMRILFALLAFIIGIMIWVSAARIRAAEEAQAATRTPKVQNTGGNYHYPFEPNTGLEAADPYMVESLPATPPEDGEPPEAIDIVHDTEKDARKEEVSTPSESETEPAAVWESLGVWKLTAYCPCGKCNGRNAGRTASGAPMVPGRTVAVGRLPFGTHLLINGQEYVVEDRGVTGNHVDILFPTHGSALDFGVQRAEVFIKR